MDNRLKAHYILNLLFNIEIFIGLVLVFIHHKFLNYNQFFFALVEPSFEINLISFFVFSIVDVPLFVLVLISGIYQKRIRHCLSLLLILLVTICLFFAYLGYFIMTTGGV